MNLSFFKRIKPEKILWGFYFALVLLLPETVIAESLTQIQNRVQDVTEQRIQVETEISGFDTQIKFLANQITENQRKIDENQLKITETKKQLLKQQILLSEYLATMYEESQMSFFELLFKATSFSDFIDQREYMATLHEKIKTVVDDITETKNRLFKAKNELELARTEQENAKKSIEDQKAQKEITLNQLKDEEKRIRKVFADRLAKGGASAFCKNTGHPVIKANNSVFTFPTSCGYISQGFGNTEFASLDKAYNGALHNGVDVGVNTGTEIKAIGPGVVFAKGSSPSGGWGNWVMVQQDKVKVSGNDVQFFSLYAHMVAESFLNVGDKVDQNTLVGWVGGTPNWAPHLHFSLFLSNSGWSNGTAGPYPGNTVDPLDYMDIPISTAGADWDVAHAH